MIFLPLISYCTPFDKNILNRSRSSRKISGEEGLSPVQLRWTNLAKKEVIFF